MPSPSSLLRLTALLAGSLTLAACTTQTAETSTPTSDSTATPVAEGVTITLYTSEPQEKIDAVIAAFAEQRPEITVEVFRAGTGDLNARIEAERTGGDIQADLLMAADAGTFELYKADDLLLEFTPTEVDALNPDVVDPEGFYVGTRIIPTVIAYNTTMIETPPTSWQELTDDAYLNQITMPNPDVSGAAAYNAAVWTLTDGLGEEWLEALAANSPVIADSNGPVAQAVAAGTQPVGVVVDYLVRELAAAGSPIALSYPSEGVPYVSQPVGIFADTGQPEAAQAFVDFVLSADGQALAVEQSYLPVRDDVGTPEGAPAMSEITILSPSLDEVAATQPGAVARFNELFR